MTGLLEWIISVLESVGYLGLVLLIALENIFPPIPSEIILPLTGFLIEQGKMNFIGALLASTTGSILGALFLYILSSKLGEHRVYQIADAYGKYLGLSKEDIQKSITWFRKHGTKLVFFGRVIPTIRSIVSIPAGIAGMSIQKFILYTALGSAIWNTVLISIGWILGDKWEEVQKYTKILEYGVWIVAAFGVGWLAWKKRRTN